MRRSRTQTEIFLLDYLGKAGGEATVDDIMAEAERINSGERYSLLARSAPKARSSISRALRRLEGRGQVYVSRSVKRRGIPEAYWRLTEEGRRAVSLYWREQHAIEVYAPSLFSDLPCEDCTYGEECWGLEMRRLEAFLQEKFGIRLTANDYEEVKRTLTTPSSIKRLIAVYTFFPEIREAKERYDLLLERLLKRQSQTSTPTLRQV